ncbi:unnamed protein product, partial [marine sediment metagenome]
MSYNYAYGESGSIYIPVVSARAATQYDYKLGPSDQHITYMLTNHRKQIQFMGEPCYLLRRKESGSAVSDIMIPVYEQWEENDIWRYRGLIWDGQGLHPDFRTYVELGGDNTPFTMTSGSADFTRIEDHRDIIADDEYALYEDRSTA